MARRQEPKFHITMRIARIPALILLAASASALTAVSRADDAPAPDWVGSFYEGESTLAATRLEAYDSVLALLRFAGQEEPGLLEAAREVGTFVAGQQFDLENGYWLQNPSKAAGGVRESLYVHDVRIDGVQHAMSAWLHLARLLRDPAYGKSGAASQGPLHVAVP